jgi:hypothetical protein
LTKLIGLYHYKMNLLNKCGSFVADKYEEVVDKYTPHRRVSVLPGRRRKPPWLTISLSSVVNKKNKAFQLYRKHYNSACYQDYVLQRTIVNRDIRKAVRNYQKEIAGMAKSDPKSFLRYLNCKLKSTCKIVNLVKDDGTALSDECDMACNFDKFFSSVFTREDTDSISNIGLLSSDVTPLSDVLFTVSDVASYLCKLDVSKSVGPDNIHPVVLCECADQLAVPLFKLFRSSLDTGIVPQVWQDANVTLIFKSGDRASVSNYRPISLTFITYKVMEKIIINALLDHVFGNNLVSSLQRGFVPGRSTVTQLLAALDQWTDIVDQGGSFDTVYLDFAKAFDSVPHVRSTRKLESYSVTDKLLKWTVAFLTNRRQRVVLDGAASTWLPVISGVPQGSVLAPVLFVIYINDLPTVVRSQLYLYAHDTKITRRIQTNKDFVMLQEDFDRLCLWATTWQLKLNIKKCKVMHFGHNNVKLVYNMNNIVLESVPVEKDLGVLVDEKLSFSGHISGAVLMANRLFSLIKRCPLLRHENAETTIRSYCASTFRIRQCCVASLGLRKTSNYWRRWSTEQHVSYPSYVLCPTKSDCDGWNYHHWHIGVREGMPLKRTSMYMVIIMSIMRRFCHSLNIRTSLPEGTVTNCRRSDVVLD